MNTISIVISAYNEEDKIKQCLDSVQWADEIIVIDNFSTDKTVEIAKSFHANIYIQPNNKMLNINKNFGFEKANSEWILNLDADERVSKELRAEIIHTIKANSSENGYRIPRKNIIFGKWIKSGLWWPDYQIRLFRKGKGRFPCVHVHEYIDIQGKIGIMREPLDHENYQTISQFIQKMDRIYTENEAENRIKQGYKIKWSDAIVFPFRDFLNVYFAREGYKDGLHGLILSLLQSSYSLITFAKIWEKENFPSQKISEKAFTKELASMRKEINYWLQTRIIEESPSRIQKTLVRIKRKIGL